MWDDQTLMKEVAKNNDEAIQLLMDRFDLIITRITYKYFFNHEDRRDIVQEIYTNLWKTADRYDASKSKLITWVIRIATNYCCDQVRRKISRDKRYDKAKNDLSQKTASDENEFETDFFKLLNKVRNPISKEILFLMYGQGHSIKHISSQLQKKVGTIKSALSRGLNDLREINLKEQYEKAC